MAYQCRECRYRVERRQPCCPKCQSLYLVPLSHEPYKSTAPGALVDRVTSAVLGGVLGFISTYFLLIMVEMRAGGSINFMGVTFILALVVGVFFSLLGLLFGSNLQLEWFGRFVQAFMDKRDSSGKQHARLALWLFLILAGLIYLFYWH